MSEPFKTAEEFASLAYYQIKAGKVGEGGIEPIILGALRGYGKHVRAAVLHDILDFMVKEAGNADGISISVDDLKKAIVALSRKMPEGFEMPNQSGSDQKPVKLG